MQRVRNRFLAALGISVLLLVACSAKQPAAKASMSEMPASIELQANILQEVSSLVAFTNTGVAELSYSAETSSGWLAITSGASGVVPAGGDALIGITASCPGTASTRSATLVIDSNAGARNVHVNLECSGPAPGGFRIEVRFIGSGFTPARQEAFRDAAQRWARVIIGDLPDGGLNKPANACGAGEPAVNELIDDLLIHAVIREMDGPGGVLGSAGPCLIRQANGLPLYGTMTFDSADVPHLESSGEFRDVILHEMGHVLGIGTLWDAALLEYTTSPAGQPCSTAASFASPPTFRGIRAMSEFAVLGAAGQPPAEDLYGPGTQCGHWKDSFFSSELMTGFIGPGLTLPLSRLSAASLADLGYPVDLAAADPYGIPACAPNCLRVQAGERLIGELLLLPRGEVDADGMITPLDPAGLRSGAGARAR
jgi:hypothetical protein